MLFKNLGPGDHFTLLDNSIPENKKTVFMKLDSPVTKLTVRDIRTIVGLTRKFIKADLVKDRLIEVIKQHYYTATNLRTGSFVKIPGGEGVIKVKK